jgi:GAF domain
LLFGTGRAVGFGVTSYADALAGRLATALSEMTTRGTDVDVIARTELDLADARRALLGAKLWRFDAIVVNIGLFEALTLATPNDWRAALETLLEDIRRMAAPHAGIVVLGIEPVGSISAFSGNHAVAADERARELDAVSVLVCAEQAQVSFLRLTTDPTDYAAQGQEIADALLETIYAARNDARADRGPAGQDAAERENERVAGVVSTGIVDTPAEDRFDRIVTMARQLYGTSGAAFAVVDRDRVWHKSATEGVPREVPKESSFCSTTILQRGPHVVADMRSEDVLEDTAAADAIGVRFYAGYPVESPSGEQIGALCVFDEKPRESKDIDSTMLRQLALLIEAELQVDALEKR